MTRSQKSQGSHFAQAQAAEKTAEKPGMRRRSLALLAVVVVLAMGLVGGTVAFLVANTGAVRNAFTPASVTAQINETFDGATKSNVTVTNTGNTEAYIRAAIVYNWVDANGGVYAGTPQAGTDYTLDLGSDWTPGNDGYYYYRYPVAANGTTGNLINSLVPVSGKELAGYTFSATVMVEAIQSTPASAVQEAWGATVSTDGNRTLSKTA